MFPFVLFESFASYGTESTPFIRTSLEGRQTVHVTEVYVTGVERFSPTTNFHSNNSSSYVYRDTISTSSFNQPVTETSSLRVKIGEKITRIEN